MGGDGPGDVVMEMPAAAVDPEACASALLAELSTSEKLNLLDGDTPFWSGMADIALRDAEGSVDPAPTGVAGFRRWFRQ